MYKLKVFIDRHVSATFQAIKVKQNKGKKPSPEMFARAKQTFINGAPDKIISINDLSKEGKDVVKGELVEGFVRGFNQFDLKLDKNTKTAEYTKTLSHKRPPKDLNRSQFIWEGTDQDVADFIKKIIAQRGFSNKYLFNKFNKEGSFIINLRGSILGYNEGDDHFVENIGYTIPPIKIAKVTLIECTRLKNNYFENLYNMVKVHKKTTIDKTPMIGSFEDSDKKVFFNSTHTCVETVFFDRRPYIDHNMYEVLIDGNTVRKFRKLLNQLQNSINSVNFIK